MQRCCIQNKYGFFLPCDEADGPGIQRRDLSKSQMGEFPKRVLLYCTMIEISQKARKGSLGLEAATIHGGF